MHVHCPGRLAKKQQEREGDLGVAQHGDPDLGVAQHGELIRLGEGDLVACGALDPAHLAVALLPAVVRRQDLPLLVVVSDVGRCYRERREG